MYQGMVKVWGQQRACDPHKEIIRQDPVSCCHEGMWCYHCQSFLENMQKSRFNVNSLNLEIKRRVSFFLLNDVWATYNIHWVERDFGETNWVSRTRNIKLH